MLNSGCVLKQSWHSADQSELLIWNSQANPVVFSCVLLNWCKTLPYHS